MLLISTVGLINEHWADTFLLSANTKQIVLTKRVNFFFHFYKVLLVKQIGFTEIGMAL